MDPILADLRAAAEDALTPEAWHYLQATASGVDEAENAWRRYRLIPRVLRDVAAVDTSATLLGSTLRAPILIAPTGYQTTFHPEGEVATGEAARRAGSLLVVSTRSTRSFADIATATGDWWLQVYVMRDRALTGQLVDGAASAGARALVLTGDTPYLGSQPALGGGRDKTQTHHINLDVDPANLSTDATRQDPTITLDVIGWLAERSGLPVVVKGVVHANDAIRCADAGASAVIVSNHGARQLPQVASTASVLADVVDAVAGRIDVYVDGGLYSGPAVLTALALGAQAVLVGRPVMWGLAAHGASGAANVLDALARDLSRLMGLIGAPSVGDLDRSFVTSAE